MNSLLIVIVTYNSADFIRECLGPFSKNRGEYNVIVIDNCSSDDTVGIVRKEFPHVKLIESEVNLGFSRANNKIIFETESDYVLLLNPDAFVSDVVKIDALLGVLEATPDVAAVGPRLLNQDRTHQVGDAGWRTNLRNTFSHSFFLGRLFGISALYLGRLPRLSKEVVEVDWLCGACLLMRRSALTEVGGLNEEIFMYGEDVDWGERARDAGWRMLYVPSVQVVHLQGASQRGSGEAFYSTKWIDHRVKSLTLSRGRGTAIVFLALLLPGLAARAIMASLAQGSRERSTTMWRYTQYTWSEILRIATSGAAVS